MLLACDTHVHFYDGRHPAAAEAIIRPADATPDEYRRLQNELGTERVVVVQPTTYGLDNTCQLEAIATIGSAARGVMVVDRLTPTDELARLTDLGVRGARFHMLPGGAVPWEMLDAVAANIAPFGWHVQLQLNGRELATRCERLLRLPVALVVDHVGRFMPPVRQDSPEFGALLRLVDQGTHVKLSAPYESSIAGPPGFADVTELADALIARSPDRVLWASNWPHPGQPAPPTPTELVALRDRWLPTADLRRRVLVDNPAELYDF
jgi:D-galactarolactone isomerase